MRGLLYSGLKERIGNIKLNGHPEKHLPDILNISFKGMTLEELYNRVKDHVALTPDASYVLDAINLPEEWKRCTVRFSVGKYTAREEVNRAVSILSNILPPSTLSS